MPAFTPDAARAFGGGPVARGAAAERAAEMPWPSTQDEIWRYSRIGELDLERYRPVAASTEVRGGDVNVGDTDIPDLEAADVFSELNTAFMSPTVVRVPAGRTLGEPIVVVHRVDGEGTAHFPRLVIDAGADSDVTVVEQFVSGNGDRCLVVPILQIHAHPAARVRYLGVNDLGPNVWQIASQLSVGDRDSSTLLATVALGGDYARVRSEARIIGQGGETRQIALYFAGGTQMHDFRTTQDHAAPRTSSDLLFKGAVQDQAKSVYTGLIRIRENAKGSVAFQTNRNLTLGDGAWAESVPNLDIETNDVKCSHASTVGPIDEEQRFYLESRGVHPEVAERLVVMGFFREVLDRLPGGSAVGDLSARVAAKLQAGGSQ